MALIININSIFKYILKIIQLKFNCSCDLPIKFLIKGCIIPHPYGVTIAVNSIGSECVIYQNVTIGSNSKKWGSEGKPSIGNNVVIFSGSIISGNINIGNNVIIGANSVVTRNIPDNCIVMGINKIQPLNETYKEVLKYHKHHCRDIYRLIKGLSYNGKLWINKEENIV